MKKIVSCFIVVIVAGYMPVKAQRIYNNTVFRQISAPAYFRFHYDNDYFTKTDYYYSQGITLELVSNALSKNQLNKLLLTPYSTPVQYGLTFNLFGFTPTSIASDEILYNDRPFNANITVKSFSTQASKNNTTQLSAALSLGVMGPAAGGYEIQYNIHKWLKNPLPHGWQHQIKNDVIVNYQVNYEKQLLQRPYLLVIAAAEARAGTLHNSMSAGFNFMVGRFNKRFTALLQNSKTEYYFYFQNAVNAVGYDASLQGGIFNRKSPYTIAAKDINNTTYRADAGIVVNFKKLFFSYTQSFITKEFKQGRYHRWGGISVGFAL